VRAKRRFGQHFLSDPRILARIADALAAAPDDVVLEIGPGRGALTAELLARAGRVVAIERDRDLIPDLRTRFPRLELIEGDALDVNWAAAIGGARPWLLAGNIPYNITSPLLDRALAPPRPARIVFLVQKEVADRIAAAPGTKDYGALTVGVQAVAGVERLFAVPAGAFQPSPKVDSAVVRLTPLASPLIGDADIARFRRLVVGLFGFRRKQLRRALRELTGWSADAVAPIAAAAGLDPVARPEAISPNGFARLARVLVDAGWGGEYPS
jgi:16S rRNA (adenine1518-N6/adenine1519-N6)-dimethyltransferase